ncbi:MAG: TadE/TadG family type IV pilus assembly protein [Pseudomonadota bacterium]
MNITKLARRFRRADKGTATLEFVIVFPIIMILLIATFETAMLLTRQVMLERALDNSVRLLRLTNDQAVSTAQIQQHVCQNTLVLPDCSDVLVVDLRVVEPPEYELPAETSLCVDADGVVNPANEFRMGQRDEFMLIRVCAEVQRILPLSGWGLNLTRDNNDNLHMTSASVFVNEPTVATGP